MPPSVDETLASTLFDRVTLHPVSHVAPVLMPRLQGTGMIENKDLGGLLASLGEHTAPQQRAQASQQLSDPQNSIAFGQLLLWWNT